MLDLGWQEFFLIATIAVVVVGPKDLPKVIRTVVGWIRKVRSMARDFQGSIEEVAREAELDEIRQEAKKLAGTDLKQSILDTVDPDRELTNGLKEAKADIEADAQATENSMLDPNAGPGSETAPTLEPTLVDDEPLKGWDADSVSTPASSITPPRTGNTPATEPSADKPAAKAAKKPRATKAKKTPASKVAAEETGAPAKPARKTVTRKTSTKTATKTGAKKTTARKTGAAKAGTRKAAARKSPAKPKPAAPTADSSSTETPATEA